MYDAHIVKVPEYPWKEVLKVNKFTDGVGKATRSDLRIVLDYANQAYNHLRGLVGRLITLEAENLKLRAENEFLLRTVNDLENTYGATSSDVYLPDPS